MKADATCTSTGRILAAHVVVECYRQCGMQSDRLEPALRAARWMQTQLCTENQGCRP